MVTDTEAVDATIEAVARWLEACCPHAKAWQLRHMAARLRSGQWLDDPPKRSDASILLGRVDDKIARRVPPSLFTPAEHSAWVARNDRLMVAEERARRRFDRVVDSIEAFANGGDAPA